VVLLLRIGFGREPLAVEAAAVGSVTTSTPWAATVQRVVSAAVIL
jgi:hypothetical protein